MRELHNLRLQATVGVGLPADRERPRSPTAPEPHRWAGKAMNRVLLAGSVLILLAGCSTHAKRASNDSLGASAPCLSEVQGDEDGTCFHVVRVSGYCSSSDAVHVEYEWLTQHYPGWELLYQEHGSTASGVEDYLHIRTPDGREMDFCFITTL